MKYILWDFDGTLGYREGIEPWSDTLYSILLKNGIVNIPLEKITPYLSSRYGKQIFFTWHISEKTHNDLFNSKTWWEYYEYHFQRIFQEIGINKILSNKMSKEFRAVYMDNKKWHLFNDTIITLEKASEKQYQNIILSNHIPELDTIIENLDIKKYFSKIYSSANIGYEKPNRKIYEYVFNDIIANKDDCIIVGDSYKSDIIGGKNYGIKSILVRSENTNGYEYYCKDLNNLLLKIEEI